jgi:hypothetical protein
MARVPTLLKSYHDALRVSVPVEAGERLERLEFSVQAVLMYSWQTVVLPDAVDAANIAVSGLAANTSYVFRAAIVDGAGVARTTASSDYMRTVTVDAGQLVYERERSALLEEQAAQLRERIVALERQMDTARSDKASLQVQVARCVRRRRAPPRPRASVHDCGR